MPETQATTEGPTDQTSHQVYFVGRLIYTTPHEAKAAAGMISLLRGEPVEIKMIELPATMKRSHFMTITERRTRRAAGASPR